jgi:hypothetical protein
MRKDCLHDGYRAHHRAVARAPGAVIWLPLVTAAFVGLRIAYRKEADPFEFSTKRFQVRLSQT